MRYKNLNAFSGTVLFLGCALAHAESHVRLMRAERDNSSSMIQLECLDKPQICMVSRTEGASSRVTSKQITPVEAQRLYQTFWERVKDIAPTNESHMPARGMVVDFDYNGNARKMKLSSEAKSPPELTQAAMILEGQLTRVLQTARSK